MLNNEYCLKRLVLINSANYELAEIPLDDSVSIVAPNNVGKTSLINSLQFLLVREANKMDFGAYDLNASRKFYFPGNSSYILLEMQLPSGLVVIGCVGKGLSNDYQYFAYAGSLNVDFFKNIDGTIVEEPKLRERLYEKGCSVCYYKRSTEFFDALYGKYDVGSKDVDIRLFSLNSGNLKDVFQKVLIKTLRLERLVAADVKNFLLQINNSSYTKDVDFNKVWHEAIDPVLGDKEQYEACERMLPKIQELDQKYDRIRFLRGKVRTMRPLINKALNEWDTYKCATEAEYKRVEDEIKIRKGELSDLRAQLLSDKKDFENRIDSINKLNLRQDELQSRFALIEDDSVLRHNVEHYGNLVAEKTASLNLAKVSNRNYVQNSIKQVRLQIDSSKRELESGDKFFKRRVQSLLSSDEMDLLNGMLNSNILNLDANSIGDIQTFADWFKKTICGQGNEIHFNGLILLRDRVKIPYRGRSVEEIKEDIAAGSGELSRLEEQLRLLDDLEKGRQELAALKDKLNEFEKELKDFEELDGLRKNEAERDAEKQSLQELLNSTGVENERLSAEESELDDQRSALLDKQKDLKRQNDAIEEKKRYRVDMQSDIETSIRLPHDEFFYDGDILPCLSDKLQDQSADCFELKNANRRVKEILNDLFAGGFTKYQGQDTEDEQIVKIVGFANNLDKENQAIKDLMRTAIASVSSVLREFSSKYDNFELELKEFNSLVRKRRVSDLEQLSVEIVPEPLLDAVRTFARFAASDDNSLQLDFSASNSESGNDDIEKAKTALLRFCEVNGCLKLEHLFNLSFNVCKKGGKLQTYTDLSQIGSNGTVLMAKLIFGLALLFKMTSRSKRVTSICYLDEAASIDDENQKNLIATAKEFGFNLLFASPTPQNTVRYCVSIAKHNNKNTVSRKQWQIFEELKPVESVEATA